jgi:hypothetical protein
MNAMPPLPVNQRRRADLVCLAMGVLAFALAVPVTGSISSLRLPGLMVLAAVTFVAGLAGMLAVRLSGRTPSDTGWQAARLGARAGLFASLLSAGMTVLAARLADAPSLLAIWLAAPLCILPGALAGMAGASLGVRLAPPPAAGQEEEAAPIVTTGGISWWALPIWGLALFGLLSPFYIRSWRGYFPLPPPVIETPPPPPPAPVEIPKPSIPLPPPRPTFEFTPSPELATTKAMQWQIFARKSVPEIAGDGPLALSSDGRWIAGLAGDNVALIDLHKLEVECRWQPRMKVQSLAFSPDSRQLFLVSSESPARVGVLRVEGVRSISLPQPKKRMVPSAPPFWHKDKEVLFLSNGDVPLVLNLDTLEIDPLASSEEWRNRLEAQRTKFTVQGQPSWPESPTWRLTPAQFTTATELPEVEGSFSRWPERHGLALAASDKTGTANRVFQDIDIEKGDRFLASPDGAKFIRCRGNVAEVFYFSPSEKDPPLAWEVTMPGNPDTLEDLTVKRAVEEGLLCAFAYRPQINPLNDRVIGPDRSRVLAHVRLVKWEGTRASFTNFIESGERPGPVVIADPHRWSGSEPKLVSLSTPHRWWAEASPPASPVEPASLPPLNNQPQIVTRLEDGAMRITDIREPAAAPPSKPTSAPDPPPPTPPVPAENGPIVAITPEGKQVGDFLMAHHRKAESGNIAALISDYADRVQFLKNGTVDRAVIEKQETADHAQYTMVRESIPGGIKIRPLGEGRYEAYYDLHSSTTSRKDGSVTNKIVSLLVEVKFINRVPRIVKQVLDKSAK